MRMNHKAIFGIGLILLAVSIGVNAMFPPPSPEKLRAYMASDEYKAQKAAHFARIGERP